MTHDFGALVISLDFELHWGLRDFVRPGNPYYERFIGAREAIPRMLDLFEEYGISATWAIVGFLFASSREEMERYAPLVKPNYANATLNPYQEEIGSGERDDPYHFAPSLIDEIKRRPRQEIATHTYSHYYCLELGNSPDAFKGDLNSAVAIANRYGVKLKSIVFPRNQRNERYEPILRESGIECYRGNEQNNLQGDLFLHRLGRLLDSYVNMTGSNITVWDTVVQVNGLCNIPGSRFLRPYSPLLKSLEPLRIRRIKRAMYEAATTHQIFHLWWHPHNFGKHIDENLHTLRTILEVYKTCERQYGMRSMSMWEAACYAKNRANNQTVASVGS